MIKFILASLLILSAGSQAKALTDKDRGGGNSFEDRSLEAYIQNPKNLPAFQTFIAPLEQRLSKGKNSALFEYVLNRKTWYFLDSPLPTLEGSKIGSPVSTAQVALQGFESVWVDRKEFEKLSPKDQADILLHEVLMGIKILRYQSRQEQCVAVLKFDSLCIQQPQTLHGSISDLTPADYHEVRRTVFDIQNLPPSWEEKDFEDILARRNFSFSFSPFVEKYYFWGISGEQIFAFLTDSYQTKSWPIHRYEKQASGLLPQNPQGTCNLSEFNIKNGKLQGTYVSEPGTKNERKIDLNFDFARNTIYSTNYSLMKPFDADVSIWLSLEAPFVIKNPLQTTLGDRHLNVQFFMNVNRQFDGIRLYETVVTNVGDVNGSGRGTGIVVGGIDEYCSLKSKLKK